MTPKEKAKILIMGFIDELPWTSMNERQCNSIGKCCAIIAVDEILKNFEGLNKPEYCAFDSVGERKFTFESEYPEHMTGYDMIAYWEDVKSEIEKL